MTPEMVELARRAVACKGWRRMRGMCSLGGRRVADRGERSLPTIGALPDLTDPATLGCLLALVREACGDDEAYAQPWHDNDGGWTVCINDDDGCHIIAEGDTEVEALVAALEGAP